MSKILGLDLGTNSIGWAKVNDNKIEDIGVTISPNLIDSNKRKQRRIQKRNFVEINQDSTNLLISRKLISFFKKRTTLITLSILTSLLFLFSIVFFNNWQFWINLGIGSLIATITFRNK